MAVVRLDQAITANILRICNSAYFGLRRPKEIVAYTPVYVEITKTDEAEAVAAIDQVANLSRTVVRRSFERLAIVVLRRERSAPADSVGIPR